MQAEVKVVKDAENLWGREEMKPVGGKETVVV